MTIIGAAFQYFIGKPFIKDFTEDDWTKSSDEYLLSVPARRHRRGRGISAQVYQSSDGSYEVVHCGEEEAERRFFLNHGHEAVPGQVGSKVRARSF